MAVTNTFTMSSGQDPNTGGVFPQQYSDSLQRRLNDNNNWKETCNWMLSDSQLSNFPYMAAADEPTVRTSVTRGASFTWNGFTLTNDQLRINTLDVVPVFVDYADLTQIGSMGNWVALGERMGQIVNDRVGALVGAQHASWTDFGQETLDSGASGTTQITVSATNIDDIIRGVEREVEEANGYEFIRTNGLFVEWGPAQKEYLAQYAQANGFQLADKALKDGLVNGYYFMGFTHYVSNNNAANHLFAGIKGVFQLGLLRSTWGRMYRNEGAVAIDDGPASGVGQHMRIDYGFNAPAAHTTLLYDINIA